LNDHLANARNDIWYVRQLKAKILTVDAAKSIARQFGNPQEPFLIAAALERARNRRLARALHRSNLLPRGVLWQCRPSSDLRIKGPEFEDLCTN
jgi:hypothetical protein